MTILAHHSIESRDRETATLGLLLDLERREFDIHLDAAGELIVEPQDALTFDDLCGIARYRDDLRAMVMSCLAA